MEKQRSGMQDLVRLKLLPLPSTQLHTLTFWKGGSPRRKTHSLILEFLLCCYLFSTLAGPDPWLLLLLMLLIVLRIVEGIAGNILSM